MSSCVEILIVLSGFVFLVVFLGAIELFMRMLHVFIVDNINHSWFVFIEMMLTLD